MARPIAFDRDIALQAAMRLFWQKGYQAAALPDLLAAMAISRSSLYAAFGDKRHLFIACLDRFAETTREILSRARATRPPLAALRHFFDRSFQADHADAALGCLLVSTVTELAGVDDDLVAIASAHLARIETDFAACLVAAGRPSARADELASFLMLVNEGLRVGSRRPLPRHDHLARIETAFALLKDAA
jgi:TetR/AcrR family transcriptional repressor of nem operon